jgi:hypothetical protein
MEHSSCTHRMEWCEDGDEPVTAQDEGKGAIQNLAVGSIHDGGAAHGGGRPELVREVTTSEAAWREADDDRSRRTEGTRGRGRGGARAYAWRSGGWEK